MKRDIEDDDDDVFGCDLTTTVDVNDAARISNYSLQVCELES